MSDDQRRGGTLWIVATPIGSLGDLSPRAREILESVDSILAEDTRRVRRLLSHLGIPVRGRLTSLHEHNETQRVPKVLTRLAAGTTAALVSDAGTPVLSDPGFVLVREARRCGFPVCSVPGASAFTAALAASGQPPLPATLVGFLPQRQGARRRKIAELATCSWTLVVLLSPHRIAGELRDLADGLGEHRPATLLAEISKVHERAESKTLGELAEAYATKHPRGELTIVVGPSASDADTPPAIDCGEVRRAYERALADGLDRRCALRSVVQSTGLARRDIYQMLTADAGTRDDDES